jgi:gluconokinase
VEQRNSDVAKPVAARPFADLRSAIDGPIVVVLMGVSGSGKTTVAALLAAAMHAKFQEGDDLHPEANVQKMHSGQPLNDADRIPWLHAIAGVIDDWRARGQSGVLTCSALKRAYRDIIIGERPDVTLVYLKGSRELIARRMAARHEHFMPVALLDSQFATLEEPTADEKPVVVSVDSSPQATVEMIVHRLAERIGTPRRATS